MEGQLGQQRVGRLKTGPSLEFLMASGRPRKDLDGMRLLKELPERRRIQDKEALGKRQGDDRCTGQRS